MPTKAQPNLNRIFHAFADGARRSLIATMARGGTRDVAGLAEASKRSQAGIRRDLRVLERAGLIQRVVGDSNHTFRLDQAALGEAGRWISRHEGVWVSTLDRLERRLARAATSSRVAHDLDGLLD